MVLATLVQCAVVTGGFSEPNAAEDWREFFPQIENIDIPLDYEHGWTREHQRQYEELAPLIRRAREIASIPHCDWELDYSQGLDMLIPHIGKLRSAQMLIKFSMYGDVKSGNPSVALDGLQALLGTTKHHNTSGTIIGSLVTASAFSMATENQQVIDGATNLKQLDAILQSVTAFDEFDPFGIRASIGQEKEGVVIWLNNSEKFNLDVIESVLGEEIDPSSWDMPEEIANYTAVMDDMVAIFQMPNKDEATAAAAALMEEVTAGEHGLLVSILCPNQDRLIDVVFRTGENVEKYKQILQQKINMLRSPNAATYFLQAANVYLAIDTKDRVYALDQGDYSIIAEPLRLLHKAADMEPTRITIADFPTTPYWIAPLYVLTSDLILRGSIEDLTTALKVAGHLSQQDRLAASIAAASIVEQTIRLLPDNRTKEDSDSMLNATRNIPTADAFMISSSAKSDTRRLAEWFEVKGRWKPSIDVVLSATITLARKNGVSDSWPLFVEAMGVPDTDALVDAGISENMPDALLFAEFATADRFNEKLQRAKTLPLALRKKLTRPVGR